MAKITPKISIVMPVWGAEGFLPAALASLQAQTFRDFELICVDDGNEPPVALPHLDGLAASVVRVPHGGVSAARNAGMAAARGEWFGFLDADDAIAPGWLAAAAKLTSEQPDADLVRLRPLTRFCSDAELAKLMAAPRRAEAAATGVCVYRGEAAREWGLRRYGREGWCFMNFVRRSALGGVRFPEGMRMKEDLIFLLRLAGGLRCVAEAVHPGYCYRQRPGSASATWRGEEESLRFTNEIFACEDAWLAQGADRRQVVRAMSRALSYDFLQWSQHGVAPATYDPGRCALLALWREGAAEGRVDVGGARPWWRGAIRAWLKSGTLEPTWRLLRLRRALCHLP